MSPFFPLLYCLISGNNTFQKNTKCRAIQLVFLAAPKYLCSSTLGSDHWWEGHLGSPVWRLLSSQSSSDVKSEPSPLSGGDILSERLPERWVRAAAKPKVEMAWRAIFVGVIAKCEFCNEKPTCQTTGHGEKHCAACQKRKLIFFLQSGYMTF